MNPDLSEAYINLGVVLKDINKLDQAEFYLRKAIEINSYSSLAYLNLGATLRDIGHLKEAEYFLRKALLLNSNCSNNHTHLGRILNENGHLEESEFHLRKAIELDPNKKEYRFNLSQLLLKCKKFEEAWKENEWRWNTKVFIGRKLETSKPEWEPGFRGSVLLWAEQGIGDQIMLSTLIPDFIDQVDHLIVKVDKRLIPLLERSCSPELSFIDQEQYINESEYDYQIAMGSLPRYLRTSVESFRSGKKFKLKSNQEQSEFLRSKLLDDGCEKIVGISWKSSNTMFDSNLQLDKFITGIHTSKIRFVCLQYGDVADEIKHVRETYGIEVFEVEEIDKFNDIDGLASLISACDQIVTIENLNIFLGGLLEIDTKVIINTRYWWGFGIDDKQNFWFPSLTHFRAEKYREWDTPLRQIRDEIKIYSDE